MRSSWPGISFLDAGFSIQLELQTTKRSRRNVMNLSTLEREEVATELKRFASDLNLTDDQKEKLRGALTEAREKIAE
jgi:transcription initiation factor TFIIIB Brf1 subunit/transcription initiation factor TFIIB